MKSGINDLNGCFLFTYFCPAVVQRKTFLFAKWSITNVFPEIIPIRYWPCRPGTALVDLMYCPGIYSTSEQGLDIHEAHICHHFWHHRLQACMTRLVKYLRKNWPKTSTSKDSGRNRLEPVAASRELESSTYSTSFKKYHKPQCFERRPTGVAYAEIKTKHAPIPNPLKEANAAKHSTCTEPNWHLPSRGTHCHAERARHGYENKIRRNTPKWRSTKHADGQMIKLTEHNSVLHDTSALNRPYTRNAHWTTLKPKQRRVVVFSQSDVSDPAGNGEKKKKEHCIPDVSVCFRTLWMAVCGQLRTLNSLRDQLMIWTMIITVTIIQFCPHTRTWESTHFDPLFLGATQLRPSCDLQRSALRYLFPRPKYSIASHVTKCGGLTAYY